LIILCKKILQILLRIDRIAFLSNIFAAEIFLSSSSINFGEIYMLEIKVLENTIDYLQLMVHAVHIKCQRKI